MSSPKKEVECALPILPVADLERSIKFYTEQLGFTLDWKSETFCSISRDGCHIMLSHRSDAGGSVWVWLGLESDTLFTEYRERGVPVLQEPRNFPWAHEMKFADPDGNVLWLGTKCRSDLPLTEGCAPIVENNR